jgi:hypothetical protein
MDEQRQPSSGKDYAQEGRSLLNVLYPNPRSRKAAADRLLKRARTLIADKAAHRANLGFFLFGLSEAAREARGNGK